MHIANLQQPSCDTSLVGVVKGVFDHYGIGCTTSEAFALSGHAFAINIHAELCPSGPYCWHWDRFVELLANLGLAMEEIGTLMPDADEAARAALEDKVRGCMDRGVVCSLVGLDHQLLLGYDDTGFVAAQPWGGDADSTPAKLTFDTWQEYRAGPPVGFFQFTPSEPRSTSKAVADALDFAVDAWQDPEPFSMDGYAFGRDAYAMWLEAIDAGHGDGHGNWWNAVVWGECREQAGDYFQALAAREYGGPVDQQVARNLAIDYRTLSRLLYRASDKTAKASDKRHHVEQARDLDAACVERIAALRGR